MRDAGAAEDPRTGARPPGAGHLGAPPSADAVLATLRARGVTHVVGLPDSAWGPLERRVGESADVTLVRVTREGEAFAVAAGLWLGGATPFVAVQSTGLLESGDALRGTASRMAVPLVFLVTHRGWAKTVRAGVDPSSGPPGPSELVRPDVDSVALMLEPTLRAWGVPWGSVASAADVGAMDVAFDRADRERRPVAVLLRRPLSGGGEGMG